METVCIDDRFEWFLQLGAGGRGNSISLWGFRCVFASSREGRSVVTGVRKIKGRRSKGAL